MNSQEQNLIIKPKQGNIFSQILALLLLPFFAYDRFQKAQQHPDKWFYWSSLGLLTLLWLFGITGLIFKNKFAEKRTLILKPEGFVKGNTLYRWQDIDQFRITTRFASLWRPNRKVIYWNYRPPSSHISVSNKILKIISGYNECLESNYEIEAEKLTDMLNDWRNRYAGSISEIIEGTRLDSNISNTSCCNRPNDYVNARMESLKLQYAVMTTLILVGPLGLLYAFIGLFASQNFIFNGLVIMMLIITCLAWIGMVYVFYTLRKYWVFKISTDNSGITFNGLFRNFHARWGDIISTEIKSTGILFGGKMIEVRTRPGNFYFPLTMKEKGNEYPKLDLLGELWLDSNGEKRPITPENCMLYAAIKQRK